MYDFKSQQNFEIWKDKIPQKIDSLKSRLGGAIDFQKSDLDVIQALGNWILESFENISDIKSSPDIWDELSCFLGEVYKAKIDGFWDINLDPNNKSDVYFSVPVVCKEPPVTCPSRTITTHISRKNPDFLIESVKKQMKRFGKL
ncbi:MAG: hypothetical protein CMI02_05205 [Oceanospirillaceae bacterium]|nr:hypothetical protein [Oceanospirillaceae bacterium]MBT11416.1 hypothetical protein [Oceanospirillaceae bacterium]|tara:strand:+ start:613 stop:1044 length:432 start_codon:yes stop_codon:yes gene_type:complete